MMLLLSLMVSEHRSVEQALWDHPVRKAAAG